MKKSKLIITYTLISIFCSSKAQPPWVTITPNSTFYSFSFPDVPQLELDSPMLKIFKFEADPEITLFSAWEDQTESFEDYLQQEDPMDSNEFANLPDSFKSPLYSYKDFILVLWDSTSLDFFDTNFTDTALGIKGIEFQITYFNRRQNIFRVICARVFSKNFGMLNFAIDGPSSRINDILAIKSEYFDSITFTAN